MGSDSYDLNVVRSHLGNHFTWEVGGWVRRIILIVGISITNGIAGTVEKHGLNRLVSANVVYPIHHGFRHGNDIS
jgi:hypothetical protein